jgi:hypothetical protein
VSWTGEEQLSLLKNQSKRGRIGYLDTTGKVAEPVPSVDPDEPPKECMYSALVVKDGPGHHSVPVSEMLSTSQTAATALNWLTELRLKYSKSWSGTGVSKLFQVVVTDDSW